MIQYIPLIISILSILISIIAVWINQLKPAKILLFEPNRISISVDPFYGERKSRIITVTLTFYNSGANYGVVNDLILIIDDKLKKRAFRTYLEFSNKTNSYNSQKVTFPESKAFNSFQIKGKESIVKIISFRQVDTESIDLANKEYSLLFYIKTNQNSNFIETTRCCAEFTQSDIDSINKIKTTPQQDGRDYVEFSEINKPVLENETLINNFIKKVGAK